MDGIEISPLLEEELLAMIGERKVGRAIFRLRDATGLSTLECSAWVKDRIPYREWYPHLSPTPCPYCKAMLKTALAQQCLSCGADWHDRGTA